MKGLLKITSTILLALIVRLFVRRHDLPQFQRVLVLAPHPDDEILGLGGILLQMKNRGVSINIVYVTDGEGSAMWSDKKEIGRQRQILSEKVLHELKISPDAISRMHLPDGNVPHHGQDRFDEAVNTITRLMNNLKPDAVFATHTMDYWPYDHVACGEIAKEVFNQLNYRPKLYYYWVWAWYNLRPLQIFSKNIKMLQKIDIKGQMPQKERLMKIYLESFTPEGKPWSGVLPSPLLRAFKFPFEIVERIDCKSE